MNQMEVFEGGESEQQQPSQLQARLEISREREEERERYLEPALSIPLRHYSLDPDCIGGWKPKPKPKPKGRSGNVFPLRYQQEQLDDMIRQLSKKGQKYEQALIYVGPRRNNSHALHTNRPYPNPYPSAHWEGGVIGERRVRQGLLQFSSDFESGNLDAVVQRSSTEFDLYMRVDTNTRGHTNWFYYEVRNHHFIGTLTFALPNFRRPVSLYQRGLRPYVRSSLKGEHWTQQGQDISYRRRPPYKPSPPTDAPTPSLYALTFTYNFQLPHDTVRFAYAPPYPYSQLLTFLDSLPHLHRLPPFKSLSELPIPVVRIGSEDSRAVLVTARVHPGETSSSFVAEGLLQTLCGDDSVGRELRNKYVFYVVPMLNPDGVVAGNYRTSLFGKDLNRTFDQSRRFAFPEVFQLRRLAQELQKRHQKRFCLFLDLHAHSIKKNAFMYGPDYALQDVNYDLCRELPRLLAALTPYFRYYSCTFRIPHAKAATARAVLNRIHNVPFAYTLETSNGSYFDPLSHQETPFTTSHWNELGVCLAKALLELRLERLPRIIRANTLKFKKQMQILQDAPAEPVSDDEIHEDDSDMEPPTEDLPDHELQLIQQAVRGQNNSGLQGQRVQGREQGEGRGQKSLILKEPTSKRMISPKVEELSRRPKANEAVEGRQAREGSFHLPERKNISFPAVFPHFRPDIFASRNSRHARYDQPLQLRMRRNHTQGRRDSPKQFLTQQSRRKGQGKGDGKGREEGVQLQDLIKKYKFNF